MMQSLIGKSILVTGAGSRIGKSLALYIAEKGADIIIHYGSNRQGAEDTADQVRSLNRKAWIIQADFSNPENCAVMMDTIFEYTDLFALIHNAAIFESNTFFNTALDDWQRHMQINLTSPFLLSQAYAARAKPGGRIITMLDWRALRPGKDHFPYTISKAALATLTQSMALALAPNFSVNGLALGAILPPADGSDTQGILKNIPLSRWADLNEVHEAVEFLLTGPSYITGEIIHLDGGRHLV